MNQHLHFVAKCSAQRAIKAERLRFSSRSLLREVYLQFSSCRGRFRPVLVALMFGLAVFGLVGAAHGQEERRSRVPVVGKITGGPTREAFTGNVQSVDLERKLLKVTTVEGDVTEIFPVKKGMSVATPTGRHMKLGELKAGMSVLIYYTQAKDKRRVTDIILLALSPEQKNKKSPPPSSLLLGNGTDSPATA